MEEKKVVPVVFSCSASYANPGDSKGLCYVGEEISVTPDGEWDPNYT